LFPIRKASQCTKTLANTKTPISVRVYVSCEWSTDIVVPVWLSIGLVRFDQRETCHNNWHKQFGQRCRVKNFSVPISSQKAMLDGCGWGKLKLLISNSSLQFRICSSYFVFGPGLCNFIWLLVFAQLTVVKELSLRGLRILLAFEWTTTLQIVRMAMRYLLNRCCVTLFEFTQKYLLLLIVKVTEHYSFLYHLRFTSCLAQSKVKGHVGLPFPWVVYDGWA